MWNNEAQSRFPFSFLNKNNITPDMKCLIHCFLMSLVLAGCGQAEQANVHLSSLDSTAKEMRDELKKTREYLSSATTQSERIADAIVALQALAQDMVKMIQATFVKKPPAATDDIDAVVSGASPQSGGTP